MLFQNVTLYDGTEIRTGQAVRIEGGIITWMGAQPAPAISGEEVKDASGTVMLPGFVNTHSHIPMTLMRGYGEGLPLQRWLFEKMFPFEDQLTAEDITWGTRLGLLEMIASGTVSYSDMYYFIDEIAQATVEAGMNANIGRGITSRPDAKSFSQHIGRIETEALDARVRAMGWDSLIRVDHTIHAEYTTDEALVREVADYTRSTGRIIQVHVSETLSEHQACVDQHGMTPTEYFSRCGLFDGPAVAAHCVHVTDSDILLLRQHDVTVAHCISSNLKLGSGLMPLRRMLDQGVRVTLGTDGAASNNNLNFMEEIHLAAMVHKGVERDSLFLSPAQILAMATRNGALAQGRTETGELRVGAAADLILISTCSPQMTPCYDPLANVVYSAGQGDVALTMVNGRILYEKGEFKTLDEEKIRYMANRSQQRIVGILEGDLS
ncbi:MAG: amidohydrolase [Clostridiaceae bacterium]